MKNVVRAYNSRGRVKLDVSGRVQQVGVIGVDSGQVLVCDPCYIDAEWTPRRGLPGFEVVGPDETFSMEVINRRKDDTIQLNYKAGHPGVGVASNSGMGDGSYPVFAVYRDEGFGERVMGLFVDFSLLDYENSGEYVSSSDRMVKLLFSRMSPAEQDELIADIEDPRERELFEALKAG